MKRNSNLELLRIIAMITIVGGHVPMSENLNSDFFYSFISRANLFTNGNFGTCIFGLLAGYFLCSSNFSFKKLFKLIGQILFYSITIAIVFKTIDASLLDTKTFIKSFFPISSYIYWFASAYILVYTMSPFIKISLLYFHKDYKKYDLFFIFISCITVILSFVTPYNLALGELGWMIYLFYSGDYIRTLDERFSIKKSSCLIVLAASFLIIIIYSYLINYLSLINPIFSTMADHITYRFGICVFISSCALVLLFSKFAIKSKIINCISSTTFGIYLLHSHFILGKYIWSLIGDIAELLSINTKIYYFLLNLLIVFVSCGLIDYIRQLTVEKLFLKIIDKPSRRLDEKITNILS